jgi:hypothetical protein
MIVAVAVAGAGGIAVAGAVGVAGIYSINQVILKVGHDRSGSDKNKIFYICLYFVALYILIDIYWISSYI